MSNASVQIPTSNLRSFDRSETIGPGARKKWANFWLHVLFALCERAPWLIKAGMPIAFWLTWHCARDLRLRLEKNAQRLLGPTANSEQHIALSKAVLSRFFNSVVELGLNQRRSSADLSAQLESVQGTDLYQTARSAKCGAILVSAHLGSFETAIAMLASHEKHIHVVFQRDPAPAFERQRSQQHARLGVIEAPVDDGLMTWFSLRAALQRDEVVLIQADRVMPGQRGVMVQFMGGTIEIPAGPIKLAEATGAPIIPIFAIAGESGKVRILINEPLWMRDFPTPRVGDSAVHPALLRIAGAIEDVVRAHPDQWLCLHNPWLEDLPATACV